MSAPPTYRQHGTTGCYTWGPEPGRIRGRGCRCDPCRAAQAAARDRRIRAKAYGRWNTYTDAGPVRDHVLALDAAGISQGRLSALTGLSQSSLIYIMGPAKRVRVETATRILAVKPTLNAYGYRARVEPAGTVRRIQALVAVGYPQSVLAAYLGRPEERLRGSVRSGIVTASLARAVRELYDRLWDQPPPQRTRAERTAMSYARNYAAARGWVPPLAWDDDTIDDPSAGPAEGWKPTGRRTRRAADVAEDAAELLAQGYTRDQARERLRVGKNAFQAALRRTGQRAAVAA